MRRSLSHLIASTLLAASLSASGGALAAAPADPPPSETAAPSVASPDAAKPESAKPEGAKPETGAPTATLEAPEDPPGRTIGDPDAPVTIIEYASMTCPHCRAFHVDVLPQLRSAYIDTGKAKLIFRDFPLDRLALAAAMVARCAAPEKSMAVTSRLFETQPTWARSEDPIAAIAKEVQPFGLDEAAVEACIQDEDIAKPVLQQALYGQETFEIRSTPTFIIDGEVLVGTHSPEAFAQKIDAALK